jgi:tetraacyldisaccharide 4'-kinase
VAAGLSGLEALLQRHAWRARPSLLARALQPLSWLYAGVAAVLHGPYRLGLRCPAPLPVPVVVVGNLVVGGAGKTPTVIALVRWLCDHGWHPGVVSRGYGRRDDAVRAVDATATAAEVGDEPQLIARRTGVPVVVGADRVAAARALLAAHPQVDVLVSDDGLQHHRLPRDLAIVVFDERGTGNGLRLPAGPLRAPMPRAVPPHTLVLYNAERPTTPWPGSCVRRALAGAVALDAWWRGEPPTAAALAALRGRPLRAAAGIASPQRFFAMLEAQGLAVEPLPLPDHHDYATLPWPADTPDVVVTEKDAVKLDPARVGTTRVWVAPLDFAFDPAFDAALTAALPAPTETRR